MNIVRKFKSFYENRRVFNHFEVVRDFRDSPLSQCDVTVIMIGHNTSYFLPLFHRHYSSLGASKFVYIDNGSTDNSIDIATSLDDMVVVRSNMEWAIMQSSIRRFAIERFVGSGWFVTVDSDELLEYPNMETVDLPSLARSMEASGYTGLVAQMLDMLPAVPLNEVDTWDYQKSVKEFTRCSVANVTKYDFDAAPDGPAYFLEQNELSCNEVKFLYGGVRRTLFGENPALTKHVLCRLGPGVVPQPHPHVTTGLRIAPITVPLKHYKLAGGVANRERRRLEQGRVSKGKYTEELQSRAAGLARLSRSPLQTNDMLENPDYSTLVDRNFLVATKQGLGLFQSSN